MPLSDEQFRVLCSVLFRIPGGGDGRRLSFLEISPLLGLNEAEREMEFQRVCSTLRYVERRFSCSIQSAMIHRLRLI